VYVLTEFNNTIQRPPRRSESTRTRASLWSTPKQSSAEAYEASGRPSPKFQSVLAAMPASCQSAPPCRAITSTRLAMPSESFSTARQPLSAIRFISTPHTVNTTCIQWQSVSPSGATTQLHAAQIKVRPLGCRGQVARP
jgi:hypothetical protein